MLYENKPKITTMKTMNYIEVTKKVGEIRSDANEYYSDEIDDILERGFNPDYPIVVDQYGNILDGQHRFEAFQYHNRVSELVFVIVHWEDFLKAENNNPEKFDNDDEYFYQTIAKLIKL